MTNRSYLKLLILFGLQAIFVLSTETVQRDENVMAYQRIGHKFYYIEQTYKVNWFEAVNQCRQNNGTLLDLISEAELQLLSPKLNPANSYWLAINDLGVEGVYASQATGLPVIYLNWAIGQPDNIDGGEHCVELWSATSTFRMNDVPCGVNLFFICEATSIAEC